MATTHIGSYGDGVEEKSLAVEVTEHGNYWLHISQPGKVVMFLLSSEERTALIEVLK